MNVKPGGMRKPLGKSNFDDLLSNLNTPQTKKPRTSLGGTPSRPSPGGQFVTPSRPASAGATPGGTVKRATPPASRFETRTNAGEEVESLNGHLQQAKAASASSSRVQLASSSDPQAYNYRYMFEKIMDRSEVLDNKIDECAELLKQYYSIEDFGDPGAPSQEDLIYVGRIQSETSESSEADADPSKPIPVAKLSTSAMVLETSRLLGAGSRIALRFDKDVKVKGAEDQQGGVGLFPGAIVAVRGRNAGGSYLGVHEVIVMPPVDLSESSTTDLYRFQHSENKLAGRPLSIISACGPYTVDENLDYGPLDALCAEAKRTKPDALLLMGPFVDDRHPLIKAGDVDDLPQGIFAAHVSSRLGNVLVESPSTTIILIPSTRDLISKNAVFPQGPYDRDPALELPKRVRLLPNPAMFSINEIVFGVTSTDTLFHLNNQETFKDAGDANAVKVDGTSSDPGDLVGETSSSGGPKDRLARMCRHVLRQRSFYPLFPSPVGAGIEPINLDVTHLDLAKITEGPDVLILPSLLRYFVKTVDSTVVVNPSLLTRASNGGTFAKFAIHPMTKAELGEDAMAVDGEAKERLLEHRIYERARVDIVRI